MKQKTESMLSPKEVADLLGVTERTLYTWRERGEGPAWVRIGRNGFVRYNPMEVRTFYKASRAPTGVR